MSATIIDMDYRQVDTLNVDQLEIDDLVEISGEVVKIVAISPLRFGYAITFENEFGEKDIIDFDDYSKFKLFILE
jgi:hypothetical protein